MTWLSDKTRLHSICFPVIISAAAQLLCVLDKIPKDKIFLRGTRGTWLAIMSGFNAVALRVAQTVLFAHLSHGINFLLLFSAQLSLDAFKTQVNVQLREQKVSWNNPLEFVRCKLSLAWIFVKEISTQFDFYANRNEVCYERRRVLIFSTNSAHSYWCFDIFRNTFVIMRKQSDLIFNYHMGNE